MGARALLRHARGPAVATPTTYNVSAPSGGNDTAAIQAALNSAASTGGVVQLQAGVYLISAALSYGSNTTLRGAALDTSTTPMPNGKPTTTIRNLTSRAESDTVMLVYKAYATQTNITVERITWDQRGDFYDTGTPVVINPNALCCDFGVASGATVQDCHFHNQRQIGIYFDMSASAVTQTGFRFLRNYCRESHGDFISTFGACADGVIAGNFGENTLDDCIAIQDKIGGTRPFRILIANNKVLNCGFPQNATGATANGINIWGGTDCVADSNYVQNVYASCIRAGGGMNRGTTHIVRNNWVTGSGWGNDLVAGTPAFGLFYYNVDGLTYTNNYGWNNLQGNIGGFAEGSPNTGVVVTDGTPQVPTSLSGCTLWLDASQHLASNLSAVSTALDYSGNGRHGTQTGAARPTFRVNQFPAVVLPEGPPGFDFDGTDDYITTGLGVMSSLVTASAYTAFFVVNLDNAVSDNAATSNNALVWGDHAVPCLGSYTKATGPTMNALNYDGSADTASVGFTLGVPAVFMQRHEAGNLYIARNGGTETTIASGNTTNLTGALFVGQSADLLYMDGRLGELIFYNRALTTGEVTTVTTYLRKKWQTG